MQEMGLVREQLWQDLALGHRLGLSAAYCCCAKCLM